MAKQCLPQEQTQILTTDKREFNKFVYIDGQVYVFCKMKKKRITRPPLPPRPHHHPCQCVTRSVAVPHSAHFGASLGSGPCGRVAFAGDGTLPADFAVAFDGGGSTFLDVAIVGVIVAVGGGTGVTVVGAA